MAKTPDRTSTSILGSRLLLVLAFTIFSQYNSHAQATLPPAAEEALNKGIIAAKVPDYQLAIRFFEEARKLAPNSPTVLFNLGLAESKIPGRELRSIAFFQAYLALSPNASNAATIKEKSTELDIRNESNLAGFLRTVQNAASQMTGERRSYDLYFVVRLWADAGDVATAKTASKLIEDPYFRSLAEGAIAESQVRSGDYDEANKTIAGAMGFVDQISVSEKKSRARITISDIQKRAVRKNEDPGGTEKQGFVQTLPSASVWIGLVDDKTLTSAPVMDLAGYLASITPSNEPQKVFESMRQTADMLVQARYLVKEMLLGRDPVQIPVSAVEMQVLKEGTRIATLPMDGLPVGGGYVLGPKQFEVRKGRSRLSTKGTLTVSSAGITFFAKDEPDKPKMDVKCSDVTSARVPGFPFDKIVFEIKAGNDNFAFIASGTGESYMIVETVKSVCGLAEPGKK